MVTIGVGSPCPDRTPLAHRARHNSESAKKPIAQAPHAQGRGDRAGEPATLVMLSGTSVQRPLGVDGPPIRSDERGKTSGKD